MNTNRSDNFKGLLKRGDTMLRNQIPDDKRGGTMCRNDRQKILSSLVSTGCEQEKIQGILVDPDPLYEWGYHARNEGVS
jgi:hypothetical protein